MTTNPYTSNTPEFRVHQLAHTEPGLSDDDMLTKAGYVPHDGTWMRDDMIAQYRAAEPVQRWEDGLKSHAMDWAYNGMRSDYEAARDYGDHMVTLFRAGDMTAETSHKTTYPAFVAARESEPEPDSDDAAIARECQAARAEGREISDGCARAIAAQYMSGDLGAAFATSGAIIGPSDVWRDLFFIGNRSMYEGMSLPEKTAADMIGTYLINAGERGPVDGWSNVWVRSATQPEPAAEIELEA